MRLLYLIWFGCKLQVFEKNIIINALQMLKRAVDLMHDKNPGMQAGEKKKYVVKPPQVLRHGSKKTSFANFFEITRLLVRAFCHYYICTLWSARRYILWMPPKNVDFERGTYVRCGWNNVVLNYIHNMQIIINFIHKNDTYHWHSYDFHYRVRRNPKHVQDFFMAELGTSGSVDGYNQLIIKGRFQQKNIEGVLKRYISKFYIWARFVES